MYPYRNRWRWFIFGRYSHLARALRDRRRNLQDSTLDHRINSLRAWNSVRFAVSLLLSLGVAATVVSAFANLVPGADEVVGRVVTASTTLTGVVTLVYLFLTRLLSQIEIDILTILTLDHGKTN